MGRRGKGDSRKKWAVAMSILIALIMILSLFGVIIGSYSDEIKYGKYKFTRNDLGYETKINDKPVQFYTLPPETSYLNFSNFTKAKLFGAPFIITTFNPNTANDSIYTIEVARFDLANYIGNLKVYNVVSEYSESYAQIPVISCANATTSSPVIVFNVSDKMEIVDSDTCVYFNGKGTDFLKFRDLIIYSYFRVE